MHEPGSLDSYNRETFNSEEGAQQTRACWPGHRGPYRHELHARACKSKESAGYIYEPASLDSLITARPSSSRGQMEPQDIVSKSARF